MPIFVNSGNNAGSGNFGQNGMRLSV